jgi:cell division protease FtsH
MIFKIIFLLTNSLFINAMMLDSYNKRYTYDFLENKISAKLPYKSLIEEIENKKISKIYFSKSLTSVISEENGDYVQTSITPIITNNLVDISIKNNIDTVFFEVPQKGFTDYIKSGFTDSIEPFFGPIIFFTIILPLLRSIFLGNRMKNMPFLKNNNINKDKSILKDLNISLSSFAGSDEIFEECTEVVSYLKNSTLYKNAGVEIPKGILLEGPPGTGKTLLAKAIASEANANFISISASEFIEVFVGVGALKVRNLFKDARDNLPCIIFIDEIDSIGKARGADINFGNDEREQTLNQLLAEMDGFTNNNGILVMAATNRKDILDNALLRPGRFDRIIKVPLPDSKSRKEIIKVHSKNKNLDNNINLDLIVELTNGFSGAQIKNLLNEAAIYAVRNGRNIIIENDIMNSLDKLFVGILKKNDDRTSETVIRIAIHEAGHAILCKLFDNYFNLKKISIQSSYNGVGGYTLFTENKNITSSGLYTKDILKKRLIILMGGKAAEYLYYSKEFVSLGAIQDLKEANALAKKMIENYGMGDNLEVFYNDNIQNKYSENTKEEIDREILKLVNEAYETAKNLLLSNKYKVDSLVSKLIEKNIIYEIE